MLLLSEDFVADNAQSFFAQMEYNEPFVKKHNSNMYVHKITLGFYGGHFEKFFYLRDKRCSFHEIMKQINEMFTGRYYDYRRKKYLKDLGEIICGELSEIIAVESYMVYIPKEDKISK